MLGVSTLRSTRNSTWSHAPTPTRRGSCGRWTSTRSSRGGCTWPARRRAAPSSTTWSRGCCRRWGCAPSIFHFNPGYELDQDYYLDVGRYTPGQTVWHSEDHYLDLVVRTGKGVELDDVDELLTAVRHGLLTPEIGEEAVRAPSTPSKACPATTTTSTGGFLARAWISPGVEFRGRHAVCACHDAH